MVSSLPVVKVFRILNQCMRVMNVIHVSKPPLRKIKNNYLYVVSFHLDSKQGLM